MVRNERSWVLGSNSGSHMHNGVTKERLGSEMKVPGSWVRTPDHKCTNGVTKERLGSEMKDPGSWVRTPDHKCTMALQRSAWGPK